MNEKILHSVTKPGRYTGGEFGSITKDRAGVDVRFALCFPDVYEIGMSNLGMRILYGLVNSLDWAWCERVFAPWSDMEEVMRREKMPLYALESGDSIRKYDFLGFSLQYELSYTNILNVLSLAGIPMFAAERDESHPLIIGGGPGTVNPEPLADFFDLFLIGDAEEALIELLELYRAHKKVGGDKEKFLRAAAQLEGIYVPSLYSVKYNDDGTIHAYTPTDGAPAQVKKRVLRDLDSAYFPTSFPVPNIEVVHDRVTLELTRGCFRGCRFCQAGMIYRPVRSRKAETLLKLARETYENTGYDEISLASLSVSDYPELEMLTSGLREWTNDCHVNLSLPSQRIDAFTPELMKSMTEVRTGTVTFAPEAGSQRLRDAIRKDITDEHILRAANVVFASGKKNIKLYFMMGLPTETEEDLLGIVATAEGILDCYYQNPDVKKGGKPPELGLSVAIFVPKPHTPFQWEAQDSPEQLHEKTRALRERNKNRKIKLKTHDVQSSRLEGVFARGDRRLSKVLLAAHSHGLKFCAWTEHFDYTKWQQVFDECNVSMDFYATRERNTDEVLPWDIIDVGVTKSFLLRERNAAYGEVKEVDKC